jgi:hypothetical protein
LKANTLQAFNLQAPELCVPVFQRVCPLKLFFRFVNVCEKQKPHKIRQDVSNAAGLPYQSYPNFDIRLLSFASPPFGGFAKLCFCCYSQNYATNYRICQENLYILHSICLIETILKIKNYSQNTEKISQKIDLILNHIRWKILENKKIFSDYFRILSFITFNSSKERVLHTET